MTRSFLNGWALALCLISMGFAATPGSADRDARAILEKNYYGCHGAAQMSGPDLPQREAIPKGGKRGAAIVPGNPEASVLFRAISGKDELKMPPGKQPLSADA